MKRYLNCWLKIRIQVFTQINNKKSKKKKQKKTKNKYIHNNNNNNLWCDKDVKQNKWYVIISKNEMNYKINTAMKKFREQIYQRICYTE